MTPYCQPGLMTNLLVGKIKKLRHLKIDFNIQSVYNNNLLNPSDIKDAKCEPKRQYPPTKVFRELIVNACVHRNYSIVGSKIRASFIFNEK